MPPGIAAGLAGLTLRWESFWGTVEEVDATVEGRGGAPDAFRRSSRGKVLKRSRVDRGLSAPLDELASRLGAVRKRKGPRAPVGPRSGGGSGMWREGSGDEDAGRGSDGSASDARSPRHRQRSGRMYTGRNAAQTERVRRSKAAVGPASRHGRTGPRDGQAGPGGAGVGTAAPGSPATPVVASPAGSATAAAAAPAAAAEPARPPGPPPSAPAAAPSLDPEVRRWVEDSGAGRFADVLSEHDLTSPALLKRLAAAGRLSSALREAGIGSVGARESLVMAIEAAAAGEGSPDT